MLENQKCVFLMVLVSMGSAFALLPEDLYTMRTSPRSLQEECSSRCPDLDLNQNRTDDISSEVGCGVRCKIDQCTKGCAAWQKALETSCQAVCNGTQELLPPKELYCVLGCHDALNRYFHQLKAEIGVPPAPALVADSLTATSLRLEWKGIDIERRGGGISYLVQWRYEELAETWQYCRNQSWGEDDQILVDNLQPYTKYRFRVALLLRSTQHNTEPIVSAPSVVILTKPSGLPTSAPVIVRAAAVDSCRVSVSWEPGPFPNGPLLSYVLRLQGSAYSQLKDIPISENTDHYMFQNLEPNRNYSVSVTMRNAEGEGPPVVIYISTSPEPAVQIPVKDMQQPILILGGEHAVMKQGSDMLDEPSIIYETTGVIRGVAIHVASAQLFVSDSMGYVYRTSIFTPSQPTVVLNPSQANFKPLSLSVDWLNLHLYVLGEVKHATTVWQIARCSLDGKGLTVAMAGFLTRPSHIEVDPYNGYLFLVTRGGLYRLDLADISNGVKHEVQPFLILEDANLGAFTVDHTNFRLLVPHHTQNTVKSVSLDGKEVIDLRANTQQPRFKSVVSLAMANGLFYWTNGEDVLTEGYHSGQNRYFHNAFPRYVKSADLYISVNVLMDASQPVPVPVNPPTGVQAVLGSERAKVSWQAPHLLGGQGKGAWQNWSYELEIRDDSTGETIHQKEISGSTHTVYELGERSDYSIKAAAYTSAGRGPWSTEFKGRTLKDGLQASILWSATEGLLRSDVTGESVDTLIHKTSLKEHESEYHIVDLSWYKDVLYLVGNNSALYQYNLTNHHKSKLNINSIGSIAVDWISKKLYLANPKQQIITRSNLNGSQQEPLSILAIVKELMIDSLEAYLYWSTGHAVEVSRLNGQDRRYYHSDEIFNGKQVMGLTLDMENRYVYWIVRSYESGSIVYRAPTSEKIPMSQKIVPEKISTLQHPNIQGPLCYFSQHLLWLQDNKNAVIGDLAGQNTAIINGITLSDLYMVSILDSGLHQYPKSLTSESIVVLPNAVDLNSIRVEGSWRNFKISWDPVINTNYGTVFYEVKFADHINTNSNPEITTETFVPYNNSEKILPYTLLEVTIKAFTYWETAHHTRKILRSPQSVPSQPINPRAYVEFHKDPLNDNVNIVIIFRWDSPQFPNGLIQGYTVQCWYMANEAEIRLCDSFNIPSTKLEYILHDLLPNVTYYFQVQAYTEVGAGPYTDTISISTEIENPLPQLLITTMDMVRISDLDQQINYTINRHSVRELAYLASDTKIFWINEMKELVTSFMNGENATKILSLNNSAYSICIDWVSRSLFWTESSYQESGGSYIMKLDLTAWDAGILKYKNIVTRSNRIVNLDISPLRGTLYWVELHSKHDQGVIMHSDLFGGNVKPFFNHMEDCSCPYRPQIKPVLTVDNTDSKSPGMFWVSREGHLNYADIDGCTCNLIVSSGNNKGLPPTSLTADKINVYWSNIDNDKIYFVNKIYFDENEVKEYHLANARSIKAIGKSLQPYPDTDCLTPYQTVYNVQEVSKTTNSITIKMPFPIPHEGCESYSLPSTLYTVYVSQCLEDDPNKCENNDRIKLQTYQSELKVSNLKPFTEYKFKLALSNYYSDSESLSLEFSSGVVLRTGTGIPTEPQNVSVHPLTPTTAGVFWTPPKKLNAAEVQYEIHWTSVRLVNGVRPKAEKVIKHSERLTGGKFSAILHPLLPGQEYRVHVRAYPPHFNDSYSQSSDQVLTMYPEPNNLTCEYFVNALTVFWIPTVNLTINHSLEFTSMGLEKWQIVTNPKFIKNKVEYHVKGLQPKTLYKFRLRIRYPLYDNDFLWPSDARFTFQTLGDVPSAPGIPSVTRLRKSVYQISWEPARAHGSQITLYRLEGKVVEDPKGLEKNQNKTNEWMLYYNGTDNYWIITGEMDEKYRFRVKARNAYGFGSWSKSSSIIDLTDTMGGMLATQPSIGLVLVLSVALIISIMLFYFCYLLCRSYRQRKEDKKAVLSPVVSDMELATLREIPRGNFVQSNALYAPAVQSDPDDAMLPKITRDQITLAKFLGSGAFGEVFQGNAKDLNGPGITPVAIKTLRKGASAQEKTEFIQEARLMSHFRHKHVLRLLGVCLDTDPPLLVLELMEAGDLLSYLRASRAFQPSDPNALHLQDLLAMCEDVARGCRYLEELHFVHRDLACRNCLVSAKDRENRVVKIGDFGLARDIYKNDYYRKEGEGLLPVRWMAPESLVDGVFTSQSDVWAFGVLMWEITSLGQQPYPARTNLEVLHHVRAGGRLSKPLNCPHNLHQLMLRCWSSADSRPSFKICLEQIIALRSTTEDRILNQVHPGHYLARRGVFNMAYFADENRYYNTGNSWKSSSSEESRDLQPFLQETTSPVQNIDMPKYLELLSDGEESSIAPESLTSGYEVPKSVPTAEKKGDSSQIEISNPEENETPIPVNTQETISTLEVQNLENRIPNQDIERKPRQKRLSVTSLNLPECRRASITSVEEKSRSLDNQKLRNGPVKISANSKGSLTFFSDFRKQRKRVERGSVKGSEISLEEKSSSSLSSNASLAPSTRPSSSLINSHSSLPIKTPSENNLTSETNLGTPVLTKVQRTPSSLQKAKIPLVINNALLNLLQQIPGGEENEDIISYTNINTDAVRVNGS